MFPTPKQIQFLRLLEEGRTTDEARQITKINPRSFYEWRADPKFLEAILEIARRTTKGMMGQVYTAMIKKASDGNVQAARLLFDAVGETQGLKVEIAGLPQKDLCADLFNKV